MGITIIQKSDLSRPKPDARRALVLAGGAISGGAFKVGGLLALDRFTSNLSVTDFDMYLGISAGAFLAAPLSAGLGPRELYGALQGRSERVTMFTPAHFYLPNYREFATRPARFARDMTTYGPRLTWKLAQLVFRSHRELRQRARHFLDDPNLQTAEALVEPFILEVTRRPWGQRGGYLPSGIFDNRRIADYIRHNLERNGLPNNFRQHKLHTGKSLYIGATNLNTAQGVVFGHDEDTSVTISEAVQASTAIPGYFKPARVGPPGREQDYCDAAIRKTANISTAVRHGAQLIVCYNPFRPFVNNLHRLGGAGRLSLADMGMGVVLNQAFRTLLHSRLRLGLEKLRADESFRGDIILIEPAEADARFFNMNPLAFWKRQEAAEHGYESVKASLLKHYPTLKRIFKAYGITVDLNNLESGVELLQTRRPRPKASRRGARKGASGPTLRVVRSA